jgi:hypothetical protein
LFYFNGVPRHAGQAASSQPLAVRLLDQKSNQKNQEKIIPAFTHKALRQAAIFSGHRAYVYSFIRTSTYIN